MRRTIILLGLWAWSANAQAGESAFDEPGFYLGGEIGARGYQNACGPEALSCDRRDAAWGGYAGYRFSHFISVEAGYLDLGEARATYPRLTSTLEVTGDIEGYGLSALLGIPATADVRFFVRAGAFRWQAETHSSEFAIEDQAWSAMLGGGFEWHSGRSWLWRCQYLYLDDIGSSNTGRANGHVVSVALGYLFHRR